MMPKFGTEMRALIAEEKTIPVVGVYDVFSATLAARDFDAIFISGFGLSASHYGLPDVGFNTWSDLVAYVQRVRTVLPSTCILVDIDDGFADVEVACHVVSLLESAGASGVILEDQARPRRCGHLGGKNLMSEEDYLTKLKRVLQTRSDMFVVARTDATDEEEILRRVKRYSTTDADALLVDGIGDLNLLRKIRNATTKPLVFNQIAGGASSERSLGELQDEGVSLAIFSTPCLFAAQDAVVGALADLKAQERLSCDPGAVTLKECNDVLQSNLIRRDAETGAGDKPHGSESAVKRIKN